MVRVLHDPLPGVTNCEESMKKEKIENDEKPATRFQYFMLACLLGVLWWWTRIGN
jgi:hypothetical protein